jgi:putative PIN family toxin of toxin-antitoxin system
MARVVFPRKKLSLCRDSKDDMLLESCLEARADYLVTGDKDLLELKELPFALSILTPGTYIKQ